MKPKMNRSNLLNKTDIWNAVITVLSELDLSTDRKVAKEALLVLQYYSELESGGHENLFTQLGNYIEEIGIEHFLNELNAILEKIGAHDYATIERKYGREMWDLYVALENDAIEEDAFYHIIEKANDAYDKLNQKLERLIETYFVSIHPHLIGVVEY